jgi:hypothetical protein
LLALGRSLSDLGFFGPGSCWEELTPEDVRGQTSDVRIQRRATAVAVSGT